MADKKKIVIDWQMVWKRAAVLFIITAIATFLLALTNSVTKDAIAVQTEQQNIEARQKVLSEADSFKAVDNIGDIAQQADPDNADIVVEAYGGYKGDTLVGYAIKTAPKGYGGKVQTLTGITVDGKVAGITILSMSETPGLGARSTESSFQQQYAGLDAGSTIEVVKGGGATGNQINAISGATITSKAVTRGVNTSCKVFKAIMEGQK